mgnify:CR=1 FL=1
MGIQIFHCSIPVTILQRTLVSLWVPIDESSNRIALPALKIGVVLILYYSYLVIAKETILKDEYINIKKMMFSEFNKIK